MMAAKASSAEFVELLLQHQADPNLLSLNNEEQSALAFALKTGNEKIISLLSEVTTQGMESCVRVLAESKITVGKEIKVIPFYKLIQEGKKDLSRRGFNEWNAADLETLSSLYESFYGCTMNLEKDKSLQDYISRITNLSDGPLWSEVMIRCRKLHNSGKMTQSQVAYYEDLVSHNPYDLSYYFKFDRDLTTIENT